MAGSYKTLNLTLLGVARSPNSLLLDLNLAPNLNHLYVEGIRSNQM